jgi:hypothetical protein
VLHDHAAKLPSLHLVAAAAINVWLRLRTNCPNVYPGVVMALHTFGHLLFWQPPIHGIVTAGIFDAYGVFRLPQPAKAVAGV